MDGVTTKGICKDPLGNLERIRQQHHWIINSPMLMSLVNAGRLANATDQHILRMGWPCQAAQWVRELCRYHEDYIVGICKLVDEVDDLEVAHLAWSEVMQPFEGRPERQFIYHEALRTDAGVFENMFPDVLSRSEVRMIPGQRDQLRCSGLPLFLNEFRWNVDEDTFYTTFDGDGSCVPRSIYEEPGKFRQLEEREVYCRDEKEGILLEIGKGHRREDTWTCPRPTPHPFFNLSMSADLVGSMGMDIYGEMVVLENGSANFPEMWRIREVEKRLGHNVVEKIFIAMRADLGPNLDHEKHIISEGHGLFTKTKSFGSSKLVLEVPFTIHDRTGLEFELARTGSSDYTPKLIRNEGDRGLQTKAIGRAMESFCEDADSIMFRPKVATTLYDLLGDDLIAHPPDSLVSLFGRRPTR